jgi:outer membrane lipoprotein-sorting protein
MFRREIVATRDRARGAVRLVGALALLLSCAGMGLVPASVFSADDAATAAIPAAGCGSPQQCFARMAEAQRGVARIRAGFRQTKHVALLAEPLVSTGRFSFERPDHVRWEMVTPEPLVVEISGSSLRAGPPGAVADVDAGPAVGLFRDLGGLFSGASAYAGEERFTLGPGDSGPWSFVLTPRDPSVARVIRAIDIELDPATGGPRRVAITERGGDRTEIELLDVTVERAAGEGAGS